ncbi:threonine/serine exporter ThrE family protein [Escherichia coli O5:H32]|uniref:threonine/serine ThrE exporter family protein n=1 Tax=Escherichia coli TaxID=562 RepID=UPI00058A29DA|nr:threonine/serine exporter ThrE family protein [Escherichia coli]EEV6034503.1 threonine/serine exporter [Escherichia coli]EEX2877818.1 threonine/serine exporter [Escherichia coli]EFH1549213.1 threonine/serine exporter family protein [Escherichia coli]EFI7022555.1 threonine/serine exporter family protein [Escherichia coli]EFN7962869.1 threonine/serine exporter [Escherichia coli]
MRDNHSFQRKVTQLCTRCSILLLQYGAESELIDELPTRLGIALEMDEVECAISSNAIVLTTFKDGIALTTTRKNDDRGINMDVITQVQHIVILAERKLLDYRDVEKKLVQITPHHYSTWQLAIMVGLSCACFCKLNMGGWDGAFISFIAGGMAMLIRLILTQHHTHPHVTFFITAFVATSIAGGLLDTPIFEHTPTVALASSALLLVPGFPLINAVADMFKGYINTGMTRWGVATLLTIATCMGMVMAMTLWGGRMWQ